MSFLVAIIPFYIWTDCMLALPQYFVSRENHCYINGLQELDPFEAAAVLNLAILVMSLERP